MHGDRTTIGQMLAQTDLKNNNTRSLLTIVNAIDDAGNEIRNETYVKNNVTYHYMDVYDFIRVNTTLKNFRQRQVNIFQAFLNIKRLCPVSQISH